MRSVKYFFRSVVLIVMVGVLWGKSIYAQTSWTDSLRVSIVDSTVVSASGADYLEFKIVVERINANWNMPDTVLGNSDLYFYANFEAFDANPVFTHVHDSLSAGTATSYGNPDAILQANIGIWAERLHIALTRQDQGNALIGVTVNPNAKYKLKLAVGKPDTLCTVQWKLKKPHSVKLGIKWDAGLRGSTGLQTYGGNPIIETLTGDVEKLPADSLEVDCMPDELYACEGSAMALGMHAVSTGVGPIFEWYDSIPGGDRSYPVLASATTQDQTTSGGKRYTYDYHFNTTRDTLYIDKVPNSIDSIYFYCVVSDTTLVTRPTKYCKTRLFVRDSIKGFVSPLNDIYTLNKIDTVTICPEDSVVSVRFNFFGVTIDELADVDSIYMIYRNDPGNGGVLTEDTVGVSMSAVTDVMVDGRSVWYWEAPIKAKRGKVYIQKIGTYYCDNATVATEYDTIFIKEDGLQMLPRVTVAAGKSVEIDSKNSTIFNATQSYTSMNLISLKGLGTPKKGLGNKLPFTYLAKDTMGMDTVLYENVPGKQCAYMREVEVQSLKYLTLKVYLGGAWLTNDMYAFMGREQDLLRYTKMLDFYGAYYKSPDSTCLIPTERLKQIIRDRENNGGVKFVDWIRVCLVKAVKSGPDNKPFRINRVVDSLWGFVQTDGIVCDTAGNPYLGFRNLSEDDCFVVVTHRNHLGIISNVPITLSSVIPSAGVILADFTSLAPCIVAGQDKDNYWKKSNRIFMIPGDVDGTGVLSIKDRSEITKNMNSLLEYYIEDIDFNRTVTIPDRSLFNTQKNGAQEAYSGWRH